MEPSGSTTSRKNEGDCSSPVQSDLGLFSAEGPFWHYPGAALVVGPNSIALAANAPGQALAGLLAGGGVPQLRAAVERALGGEAGRISPLLADFSEAGDGSDARALDVAVMPWGQGAAALVLARDVTLERNLRDALVESRQRYKDLVESSHEFAWETDPEGRFVFVSTRGALGYAAKDLVGLKASGIVVEQDIAPRAFSSDKPLDDVEVWVRRADGEAACLLVKASPLFDQQGTWQGARGVASDITEQQKQRGALARSRHQERLLTYVLGLMRGEMEPGRMLAAAAQALVPALPAAGVAVYRLGGDQIANAHRAVEFGAEIPESALAEALSRLSGGDPSPQVDSDAGSLRVCAAAYEGDRNGALCLWRTAGQDPWSEDDGALIEEVARQVGLANAQLARQEDLELQSSTDPLTGLLNRRAFHQQLEQRLDHAPGAWRDGALFYVDLDNFKQVNDRFGHDRGDAALVAVAGILNRLTRRQDLAARLGGDEFALFLVDIPLEAAVRKARTMIRSAAQLGHFSHPDDPPLGFSVGLAITDPKRREHLDSLMARADAAMYEVKHGGKGGLSIAAEPAEEDAA